MSKFKNILIWIAVGADIVSVILLLILVSDCLGLEHFGDFVGFCNENAGFISIILSIITIFISLYAIYVAIKVAKIPYSQELQFNTMISDENGKPYIEISAINVGNSPMYLTEIVFEQDIMAPLALGYSKNFSHERRTLAPYVPRTYKVWMQNYNLEEYDHENYLIKITIYTTTKTYTREIDWTRG